MSTALAHKSAPLAERLNMAPAQLELIRRMCIREDAPDDVLELYLHRCRSIGVDPFDKMIYVIPRSQNVKDDRTGQWRREIRWTFQSSIDLFRSLAEQSDDYAGQLGPFWTADGATWVDVWLSEQPPLACRVGVLRQSFKEPLWVTGTYAYYVPRGKDGNPEPTAFWKGEKGAHQLAKCVEELALRKAFPRKLHGIYGNDEMAQAEKPAKALPTPKPQAEAPAEETPVDATFEPITDEQIDRAMIHANAEEALKRKRQSLAIFCRNRNIPEDHRHEIAQAFYGTPSTKGLGMAELDGLQRLLEAYVSDRGEDETLGSFSDWLAYQLEKAKEA